MQAKIIEILGDVIARKIRGMRGSAEGSTSPVEEGLNLGRREHTSFRAAGPQLVTPLRYQMIPTVSISFSLRRVGHHKAYHTVGLTPRRISVLAFMASLRTPELITYPQLCGHEMRRPLG